MRKGVTLLLLLLAGEGFGQFPLVRRLEVRPGHHRPKLHEAVQDARGLIWVADEAALLRTDGGVTETIWRAQADRIAAMAADGNRVALITGQGYLLRCGDAGCDTLERDTALAGVATALAVLRGGGLVIGTYGLGVVLHDGGRRSAIDSRAGLPDDHVNGLGVLPDGRIAVATDQGLAVIADGAVDAVLGEEQGAPDNLVLSLDIDAEGTIWAGTDRAGVFSWKPQVGEEPRSIAQPWSDGAVTHVRAVGGMVWAATREAGVLAIDLAMPKGSYRRQGAPDREVLGMLRDAEGALWWCDGTEVLHRADPSILVVPEHEGLDLRGISAICTDAGQRLWFAIGHRLYQHAARFSEEMTVTEIPVPVDPRTPIVSLCTDGEGTIWAATFGSGVLAVRPDGRIERFMMRDGLSNDNVLSARANEDGVVFATLEGITVLGPYGFRRLGRDAGFVFDALGDQGAFHLATDGRGVRTIAADGSTAASLAEGTFYALLRARDGTVWAAGPGTGFCTIGREGGRCFGADVAPFGADLNALAESAGQLIAFGSTGAVAMDPATRSMTDVTAAFGLEDATAELNALATDPTGAIWYACSKGLLRIRPAPLHFRSRIPVAILGVLADGEAVGNEGAIRLAYDRRALVVRYTGTYYADPAAIRFQYRLQGYDDRIVETSERDAGFAALPPGRYVFQVRAFRGRAPQENSGWTELEVIVDPPWWRRPWVIALMGLMVTGGIIALLRARDRRLRYRARMEEERVRFQLDALRSQVDPHFLFNSFNALVELIETEPSKAVEHVEQLSRFFRNILQVRDHERITVAEELRLLDTYFALEQRRFGAAIRLQLMVDDRAKQRAIVPLTLQLLVENALKHNVVRGAEPFTITIASLTDDTLAVRNPLRPRSSPPRSTGFGLESITKRYRAITARPIGVERSAEEFTVLVPLLDPVP